MSTETCRPDHELYLIAPEQHNSTRAKFKLVFVALGRSLLPVKRLRLDTFHCEGINGVYMTVVIVGH